MKKIKYDHRSIEPKWQKVWEKEKLYKAEDFSKKKKSYILIEFPYPSGERLHVGHARSYTAMDVVCRKRRMQGENVLYPIGWDAFGLPAENYAVKTGIHPELTTKKNIENARKQAKSWGLSFDWEREVNTTDPSYYKWTQWIFLQLFKKGLAYRAEIPVNWCPSCKINLANEEVIDEKCERCGAQTSKRMQKQWLLKITKYAERLLNDLETVDYRKDIKLQQVNWIGKKEGINITYPIERSKETVTVFTTRPDTNFGATFIVLAPEHFLALKISTKEQQEEVKNYIRKAQNKSELERIAEGRKKTGVFTGCFAINQLTNYKMPIYISDFVLKNVGTGALVGVPGHDKRDFEFAKEFGLKVIRVVVGKDGDKSAITKIEKVQEEEGTMMNSDFLNGMDIHAATKKIMDYIVKKGWGKRSVSYHLRDWVFSRQHYWGEPIPVIYCSKCRDNSKFKPARRQGEIQNSKLKEGVDYTVIEGKEYAIVPVLEEALPVKLPYVEKYKPTETGESPLAGVEEWVNTKCPNCGEEARRETDTMPNWAGSSWYFLRYIDPKNDKELADFNKLKYWTSVDWYNGGLEHTTLHLLYSRFWHKFLYDLGAVPTPEPYAKRTSHGVVLGPDGHKMSKSKGNVINPDDVVLNYGADTLRMYEMFMGPFEQMIVWDEEAMRGIRRFLDRVWELNSNDKMSKQIQNPKSQNRTKILLNKLVKKVSEDIENLKFNTAIAGMMEFLNQLRIENCKLKIEDFKTFLKILAPFAPHISEELWQKISQEYESIKTLKQKSTFKSIHQEQWPVFNESFLEEEEREIVVQVNGRLRGVLTANSKQSMLKEEMVKLAKENESVARYLQGKKIKNAIFVHGRLINFVVE